MNGGNDERTLLDRAVVRRGKGFRAHSAGLVIGALLGLVTLFLVYAWRVQHPAGFWSTDENLYAMEALRFWRALTEGGLHGVAHILRNNGADAPLVPIVGSPLLAIDSMSTALVLVNVPFLWLLVLSAHSIYARIAGYRPALIGAVVVAFLPGVLIYSRTVNFAVPLTAVMTASMAALLASDRLRDWRWALAWGVLMGLAPLTRTVSLAMIPGLVLAAALLAAGSESRRLSMRNLLLGLAIAVLVATPWYLLNLSAVLGYLTANGYAGNSPFYVDQVPLVLRLGQIVGQDLFLPTTVVGLGVVLLAVARRRFSLPRGELAAVVVAAAWYLAILSTTRNAGTAFTLPIAPLLVAIVLRLGRQLAPREAAFATCLVLSVAAFNLVAALIPLPHTGVGSIAGVGDIGVVDGRSATDAQLAAALGTPNDVVSDPSGLGARLREANCEVAARGTLGPILTTRPDALLSGVQYCAEAEYRAQFFIGAPGCARADTACIAGVIAQFGFPTVITGTSLSPYPGSFPEQVVIPALTAYRLEQSTTFLPGSVVNVWARSP
jgi:hypothetical protein